MANPEEQSELLDSELEALLAGAPSDTQQAVREIIRRQRSNLSAEQWAAIRRVFVSDLMSMQEKQNIERKLADLEEERKALDESLRELKKLIDEMKAAGKD